MKIVHVMGYFIPEFGYQEYYVAKEHRKMGHEVYVIASDRLYPFKNIQEMFFNAGLKYTGRKRKKNYSVVDGIKVHWLPRLLEYNDFIICRNLKNTLGKINPDLVFSHESRQGLPCQVAFYKDRFGFKYIVDQHDFYHKIKGIFKSVLRNIEYFGFRKFLIDYNFRKAEKIIAVTRHTRDFLKKTHKIRPDKVELVELGVDTDTYYYRPNEALKLRNTLGIKKDEVVLIFVGTIYRRKNLELLIKAFDRIRKKYKTKLLIVGDGEKDYMNELKNLVKKSNAVGQIIFTGFSNRNELPVYYSMADIGVWPANNSVSIIEAMACRLPIVMVDWQMPHLVSHKNGFKFPFNNKAKLEFYLEKMIKDKKLREDMGKNSEKAAFDHYSYKVVAEKFLEVAGKNGKITH